MENKPSSFDVHNVDLCFNYDKNKKSNIPKKNISDNMNKKEGKGYQKDSKKLKKQLQNNKISKELKNKDNVNKEKEYFSKEHKKDKKDFKLLKNEINKDIINANELCKEENKKDSKAKNEIQSIKISSINEIRLPRQLWDISCDLINFE